ncbi:hypothetical protein LX36DRAFT_226871 [Colletotrichum falcatum]|nr:hypothetical protein LX36DRAFT_226871 [Colletotrichum falcatum]
MRTISVRASHSPANRGSEGTICMVPTAKGYLVLGGYLSYLGSLQKERKQEEKKNKKTRTPAPYHTSLVGQPRRRLVSPVSPVIDQVHSKLSPRLLLNPVTYHHSLTQLGSIHHWLGYCCVGRTAQKRCLVLILGNPLSASRTATSMTPLPHLAS